MNFGLNKRPMEYTETIRGIDARLKAMTSPDVEVPSLVPYYFTPQSALTAMKRIAGARKFEDPELLMDLGVLFAADAHVLHSICIALAANGMPGEIEAVLQSRAEQEYPQYRQHALMPLFQMQPDLLAAHVLGLVEGGQTAKALQWCEKPQFREQLMKNPELALKYVAALRNQGRFQAAMDFCIAQKTNPYLQDRKFGQEFVMARAGCRDVLPIPLDEFRRRYPDARI
jgi:hypothetical protein